MEEGEPANSLWKGCTKGPTGSGRPGNWWEGLWIIPGNAVLQQTFGILIPLNFYEPHKMFSHLAGILSLSPSWMFVANVAPGASQSGPFFPWLGADSPAHKALEGCGSCSVLGLVLTNLSHFDLLVFVEQSKWESKILPELFSSRAFVLTVLKKNQGKSRDIILWQCILLYLRGIDSQHSHLQLFRHLKNCLQEQETSAGLLCEILRIFFPYKNNSIFRMGWVEGGFEQSLRSCFAGPVNKSSSDLWTGCRAQERTGMLSREWDHHRWARNIQCSQERTQKVLWSVIGHREWP